ncbi:hypothetical protein [Bradyrhizobium elkanii]
MSIAATRIEYLTSSVEALVQVAVAAAEQENVSIGAEVTSTGLNEKWPAACSAATMLGSVVKSPRDSEKPWAPMPPNAPNGTVKSVMRVGWAGCTTVLLMEMSAPSPPGQVAVTTFLPCWRSCTHNGTAVGCGDGPSGLSL